MTIARDRDVLFRRPISDFSDDGNLEDATDRLARDGIVKVIG